MKQRRVINLRPGVIRPAAADHLSGVSAGHHSRSALAWPATLRLSWGVNPSRGPRHTSSDPARTLSSKSGQVPMCGVSPSSA